MCTKHCLLSKCLDWEKREGQGRPTGDLMNERQRLCLFRFPAPFCRHDLIVCWLSGWERPCPVNARFFYFIKRRASACLILLSPLFWLLSISFYVSWEIHTMNKTHFHHLWNERLGLTFPTFVSCSGLLWLLDASIEEWKVGVGGEWISHQGEKEGPGRAGGGKESFKSLYC